MPAKKNTAPAVVEEEIDFIELLRTGQITFAEAMTEADTVIGSDLFRGEMLAQLDGVPFVIIGGTYRAGFTREVKGIKGVGDYVSLEAIIGDEKALAARGVSLDGRAFQPLQVIRFNDGSTGIRRQITAYLAERGYIAVSDTPIDEISSAGGKMGDSEFDIPVNFWKDVFKGEMKDDEEGNAVYDFKIPRGLHCPRGLRASQYRNEHGEGTTRYLA